MRLDLYRRPRAAEVMPLSDEKDIVLSVSLPTFDGPFELLIALIKKNEWPIHDLPIVEITSQFLQYIRAAKDLDTELGGEFIETASWLVLLKSRSLLPFEEGGTRTPKEELQRAVLDHEKLKAAAEFLRSQFDRSPNPASAGARPGRFNPVLPEAEDENPTIADVLAKAQRALEAARAAASLSSTSITPVSIADQILWLHNRLGSLPLHTPLVASAWFEEQPDNGSRIALLLALLELSRKEYLLIYQPVQLGTILVKVLRKMPPMVEIDD